MNDDIDRNRRRALEVTAGVGALGVVGLSAGTVAGSADGETVSFGGHEHEASGNATLDATADALVVSGLESEKTDGVRTHLDRASTFSASMDTVTLEKTGDAMTMAINGQFGDGTGGPVGQLALTNVGDRINIGPDFGGVGAARITVGVYVDGFRVDTIEVDYTDWWFWHGCFSGGGWGVYGASGGGNPGFGLTFDERVAFETSDGIELDGDAYEFLAADPDQAVDGLTSVEARANVGELVVRDVHSE